MYLLFNSNGVGIHVRLQLFFSSHPYVSINNNGYFSYLNINMSFYIFSSNIDAFVERQFIAQRSVVNTIENNSIGPSVGCFIYFKMMISVTWHYWFIASWFALDFKHQQRYRMGTSTISQKVLSTIRMTTDQSFSRVIIFSIFHLK